MSIHALHRVAGAAVVAVLALGLAACSDGAGPGDQDSGGAASDAAVDLTPEEALTASVEGLSDDSYTLESNLTLNGMDFVSFTEIHDGDTHRSSSDLFWSIIPEATGLTDEEAAIMGDFFTDGHTETITVDNIVYLQFSGKDDAVIAEEFGEDAWFTRDLADEPDLAELYGEVGVTEVGNQTEEAIAALTDIKETGDGVYTAVLPADAAVLQELVGSSGAGEDAVPVDAAVTVELDENGLLKRMSMELPESDDRAMTLVSEVSGRGEDYGIEPPSSTNLHTYEEYAAAIPAA